MIAQLEVPKDSAPAWMIYAAFVLSIVNTLVVLWPILYVLCRDATLTVRLTRDVFFRIIDCGETLFVNAAFVASGAPLTVTDIKLVLSKTDAPTKNYDIDIISFGSKKYSFTASAEHHFDSSSPYQYMAMDEVFRPLWHGVLTGYNSQIEEQVRGFDTEMLAITQADDWKMAGEDEQAQTRLENRIKALVAKVSTEIAQLAQLEPGKYELRVTIVYQPRGGPLRRSTTKQASSAIAFEVDSKVKEQYKAKINQWLEDWAKSYIDRNHYVRFPQYEPLKRTEI